MRSAICLAVVGAFVTVSNAAVATGPPYHGIAAHKLASSGSSNAAGNNATSPRGQPSSQTTAAGNATSAGSAASDTGTAGGNTQSTASANVGSAAIQRGKGGGRWKLSSAAGHVNAGTLHIDDTTANFNSLGNSATKIGQRGGTTGEPSANPNGGAVVNSAPSGGVVITSREKIAGAGGWVYVGRDGGTGTTNVNGSSSPTGAVTNQGSLLNDTGGWVSTGRDGGTGTLNVNGPAAINTAQGNWLGAGSQTNAQGAGTVDVSTGLTMSNRANGTYNLSGGPLPRESSGSVDFSQLPFAVPSVAGGMAGYTIVDSGLGGAAAGVFAGEPVDANGVLVKHTYYGDAELMGSVDGTDYALIDNAYQYGAAAAPALSAVPEPSAAALALWGAVGGTACYLTCRVRRRRLAR